MTLPADRAIALKTKLYQVCDAYDRRYPNAAVKAVVPGFRVYKRVNGEIVGVPTVGVQCRAMIRWFEKQNHMPITGEFGTDVQNKLLPPPPKPASFRPALRNAAYWALDHRDQIGYTQQEERDDQEYHPFHLPMITDCSALDIMLCKWVGIPDPGGLGYHYIGNTGSIYSHCKHIALRDAQIGDLVVWGIDPTHHVAMIVDDVESGDPWVISHGQTTDPRKIRLSDETRGQGRPYTVCQIEDRAA